jgi:hypothetical protein
VIVVQQPTQAPQFPATPPCTGGCCDCRWTRYKLVPIDENDRPIHSISFQNAADSIARICRDPQTSQACGVEIGGKLFGNAGAGTGGVLPQLGELRKDLDKARVDITALQQDDENLKKGQAASKKQIDEIAKLVAERLPKPKDN